MKRVLSSISYIFTLLILIQSFSYALKPLTALNEGIPKVQEQNFLPPEQYIEIEVAQLAHPKIVWVNIPLLKELGFDISDTLTPAEEKDLLKSLAWVVPDAKISPQEITDERKMMVTDYYGGDGLGPNSGSARAASGGMVQIKGVGVTPHFYEPLENNRSFPGRSSVHEAIKDAVWGEVLNNELAYGANRIIAIISRGVLSPSGEAQMLEIRMDPVRAGHYIPRYYTNDVKDKERSKVSLSRLENALPRPQDGYPKKINRIERIALGLIEYSRRLGIQYAQLFMKRLYHGATSESNIEISGKMIDFGTASAQSGYEKIQFLSKLDPFGKISNIETYNLKLFYDNLPFTFQERRKLNSYLNESKIQGKSMNKMITTFRASYRMEREKLALQLIGLPRVMVESLYQEHRQLAAKLVELVDEQIKNSELLPLKSYPDLNNRSSGPIQEITEILYGNKPKTNNFIQLESMIQNLINEAIQWSSQRGVAKVHLLNLMAKNSQFINRPMNDLFISNLREKTRQVNEIFLQGNDSALSESIKEIVKNSIREIHGLPWYEAPQTLKLDKTTGRLSVIVYNAKTNLIKTMEYKSTSQTSISDSWSLNPVVMSCKNILNKMP